MTFSIATWNINSVRLRIDLVTRFLTEHREFADAVQLQKLIWGWDEIELIPLRLFIVASRIGGMSSARGMA